MYSMVEIDCVFFWTIDPGISRMTSTNGIKTSGCEGKKDDDVTVQDQNKNTSEVQKRPHTVIKWENVTVMLVWHLGAVAGLLLLPRAKYQTILWTMALFVMGMLGISAGAHRLWSHRSFKAKFPLRVFLAACSSSAYQNSIFVWARDHRSHHKFSETDGDPHNAKRGFFFAHVGWLLVRKHPDVKEKGEGIDVSDLTSDSVVTFQHRHYLKTVLLLCFVIPTFVPTYFWGESTVVAFFVSAMLRYVSVLNSVWLVNSAAHTVGRRPYDKNINPSENMAVSVFTLGEGSHNFHHVFPQDYSSSEFGWKHCLNTFFIDCMYYIGQATDLRQVSKDVILKRKLRTGDGS